MWPDLKERKCLISLKRWAINLSAVVIQGPVETLEWAKFRLKRIRKEKDRKGGPPGREESAGKKVGIRVRRRRGGGAKKKRGPTPKGGVKNLQEVIRGKGDIGYNLTQRTPNEA